MTKFSLTNQQKQLLVDVTGFLDEHYEKIPLRQRQWHVDHEHLGLHMCETCQHQPRRWDTAQKTYGRFCSSRCAHRHPSVIEKTQATCLERYGATSNLNSNSGKIKTKAKLMEKYGVEHPAHSDLIRKQTQSTLMERYGVTCALLSDTAKEKTKQTNLERYGHEHHWSSDNIREKISATNLERYGASNPAKSKKLQQRKQHDLLEKYGIINISQRLYSQEAKTVLFDLDKFKSYSDQKSLQQIADGLEVDRTTVVKYADQYGLKDQILKVTSFEREMKNFLDSLGVSYMTNNRTLISPYELDFFLPDHNIAIECNGDYWHSDRFRSPTYHYEKWQRCKQENMHLIQISESDWYNQQVKFENFLRSRLGFRIPGLGARQCTIQQICASEARSFLDQHHLQGFVVSTSYWGAYDPDNHLLGVMTFGWTRGHKSSRRFELKRFATDSRTYPGLFSRMFKTAHKYLDFDKVVSFSANDWFTGDMYQKAGFVNQGTTRPGYTYVLNRKRYHASHFTKDRIKQKFPEIYDSSMSEKDLMKQLNAHQIWDSGKTEWLWTV